MYKTVVNTENGTGTFVQGEDLLSNWVIDTGTQHDNPDEGSVQAIINSWEDSHNTVFFSNQTQKKKKFSKSLKDVLTSKYAEV